MSGSAFVERSAGADRSTAAAPVEGKIAAAYVSYRVPLYRLALRATHDEALAEDILHDAYVRLLVASRTGAGPQNVRAWLLRVTTNLVIDWTRRRRSARPWGPPDATTDAADPESRLLEFERTSQLRAALDDLPRPTRRAMLLAAAGYGPHDIAVLIGRTPGATRTLLCRARQRTRERLEVAHVLDVGQ